MKKVLFLLLSLFLLSCFQENHYYTNTVEESSKEKIDSLKRVIEEMQKNNKAQVQDSIKGTVKQDSINKKQPKPEKKPKKKEEKKPVKLSKPTINTQTDTNTIKLKDGRISVTFGVRRENRQLIRIYGMQGQIIYTFENINLSYRISTSLGLREDNTVKTAITSTNAGASMYWYETYYTFDQDNEPLTKVEKRLPAKTIEDSKGEKYFWKKDKKKWIKQEIVLETNPIPH